MLPAMISVPVGAADKPLSKSELKPIFEHSVAQSVHNSLQTSDQMSPGMKM